ncbi:CDC48 family AAA ATPase [Patescibacteria group bacterium AH-259-L07]|nr:CDC48 family AAA ATPase [Patescibacteria group bacterium AH-259-L07]
MAQRKKTVKKLTLKVAEVLQQKDIERGIARIDPDEMKRINVETGDTVEIKGKRTTVDKVHQTQIKDRGKGIIQLDKFTRENAQTGLNEKVEVRKVSHKLADEVVLTPVGPTEALKKISTRYLKSKLESLRFIKGDHLGITLAGTRSQGFTVVKTRPEGPVGVHAKTKIKIRGGGKAVGSEITSYEDIGGLDKQIERIWEMVQLPLKYPKVFDQMGIDAPKGVLLHGPPGCGKTLIARAVAHESGAKFLQFSGPEIMAKYYGESEAKLRAYFELAEANAPAIIFIDEFDAIGPKREALGGEKQLEKRVVSQLLVLMDGLKDRGDVIVIAATNIPDVLDPALRRPGRFDREICIPIPSPKGRFKILEIHSRAMPLADDVDVGKLAKKKTNGYTGADLEALCREAAMAAIRTLIPDVDFDLAKIPDEELLAMEVTWDHFMTALHYVNPSGLREWGLDTPDVSWDDIGGLVESKELLEETIKWPLKYPFVFDHTHGKQPKGFLLSGKPGTGKTLLAKAMAKESGINFISVTGPDVMNKYPGESERGVQEVFKTAKQHAPCILFFDEIDAIAPKRSEQASGSATQKVVSQLLTEMDGIEVLQGVTVLGATNRPEIIEPALLRSGRLDIQLELPIPDYEARVEIFTIHTRDKPLAKDVDLKGLAEEMEGKTGADIEAVCEGAVRTATREYLGKSPEVEDARENLKKLKIRQKHFDEALEKIFKNPKKQ